MTKSFRGPDFILGGPPKSGSTALAYALNQHPQVGIPPQDLSFWSLHGARQTFVKQHYSALTDGEAYQKAHAPFESLRYRGERATSLLYRPWVPRVLQNLRRYHPRPDDLQLVFVLRSPLERLYSQYLYNQQFAERLSLEEALAAWPRRKAAHWLPAYDYLGASFYSEALKLYQEAFGQRVGIFFMEDWRERPAAFLQELQSFLNLPVYHFRGADYKSRNPSLVPRNGRWSTILRRPWRLFLRPLLPAYARERMSAAFKSRFYHKPLLPASQRAGISSYFVEEIEALEALTHKDLSHWKH
ncbi:MAG: sulfotransferase [Schleiferiaceae bacterium]|nr:sulfotransferase [Schleiferiaceae bacterium]